MRLPKSKSAVPKSPRTPLYFASPNSMTPTPQWQEKLKLQSRLKSGEWKHSPPLFEGEDSDNNSFYNGKSDIEFVSDDECDAKSMYEKIKRETTSELQEVTKKLGARRFQRGGSQRSLTSIECISNKEEEISVHLTPRRRTYRFKRSGSQPNLTSIECKSNKEEENSVHLTPKRRTRQFQRSGSQPCLTSIECESNKAGENLVYLTPRMQAKKERKKKIEEEKEMKRQGKSHPLLIKQGSRRSFSGMEADANSYHGSVTSIEYISDEDDFAEYVYDKAKKDAEEELQRTPYSPTGKPKLVKQLSGYNFSDYLLSDD